MEVDSYMKKLVIQHPCIFAGIEFHKITFSIYAHEITTNITGGCTIQWTYFPLSTELINTPVSF